MVREIINISVGQCGNQVNNSFWNTISGEHGLSLDGIFVDNQHNKLKLNDKIAVYFNETSDNKLKYSARSLLIDSDPATLDAVKASSIASLFKPDNFCFGSYGGTGNNFAKGHYTDGAEIIDEIVDIIRRETESCDAPQGFQMIHSIGGGTGAGLGTLTLIKIRDLYPDMITSNFSVFPSSKVSDIVVEPYNATLSIHYLLENSDQTNVMDNEALFNISCNVLRQKTPTYSDLNWIISNVMSDTTASLRFSGKLNGDLRKLGVNLVPYPRLHFFLIGHAPLFAKGDANKVLLDVQEVTDQMWSYSNYLANVRPEDGKYNTAACIYRGNIATQTVDDEIAKIQQKMADDFVTWIPNNIKSLLINIPPANTAISGTLIANTTAIKGVFQRISARFAKMFKRKAFLHWYKAEGMDEMEFQEADKNNRDLITEYQDKQDAVVDLECDDEDEDDDDTIGFAVGGAKDVNNFRKLIQRNTMPSKSAITFNGLLYEYFFDTKTRKSAKYKKHKHKYMNDDHKSNDNGSHLFYPSYCYAKCKKLDFVNDIDVDSDEKSNMDDNFDYFMTVGLNSNIKKSEFKRKHLNIVIVLDISGSMGSCFDLQLNTSSMYTSRVHNFHFRQTHPYKDWYKYNLNTETDEKKDDDDDDNEPKTKMMVANESVVTLLNHLTKQDRFGFVTFDHEAYTIQKLKLISDTNMDDLKTRILRIEAKGGTDFEKGYNRAIQLYQALNNEQLTDNTYENRMIYLTDAHPNSGITDPESLLGLTETYATGNHHIYTTFIGIGLDFNVSLIDTITNVRGCNYYAVKTSKDFRMKMDEEFEFMVTPMVFDVRLMLKCEGNSCCIDKVYGTKDEKTKQIMETGVITKINTLFPSLKSKKKGGTKGGIQLIKLKKMNNDADNINVELEVTFEDRNGNKYKNCQLVTFNPPKLATINDMIDDDDDVFDNDENENFYDNLGIRKGILLCRYVELLHFWIKSKAKDRFGKFLNHFRKEMVKCNDDELQKEVGVLNKIINEEFRSSYYYYDDESSSEEEEEDDEDF